ncbi:hypothetical protein ENBRE01_3419, partial [Enteropsectra breve]
NNCKTELIDGTFQTAPTKFYQLVSINGVILGKNYPMAFMLLSNKSEMTYNIAFAELINYFGCMPDFIVCDFEIALIKSLSINFTESKLKGCTFHFGQAIWCNIQKNSLASRYISDVGFNFFIRSLLNSTFVPADKIIEYYTDIINNNFGLLSNENVLKFKDYLS